MLSWRFAPVSRQAKGVLSRSTIRCRFVSGLVRSVRFGPIASPSFCRDTCAIYTRSTPVDLARRPQFIEQRAVQPIPAPGLLPVPRRRQQVMPAPPPISTGRYSHGIPVFRTKWMPVRQARSAMRGRPPLGLGGSGGSIGSIQVQRSSGRRGLLMPPLLPLPFLGFDSCSKRIKLKCPE